MLVSWFAFFIPLGRGSLARSSTLCRMVSVANRRDLTPGLGRGDLKKHMEPTVIEGPGLDDPGLPDRIRNRDPEALRAVVETYLGQ